MSDLIFTWVLELFKNLIEKILLEERGKCLMEVVKGVRQIC